MNKKGSLSQMNATKSFRYPYVIIQSHALQVGAPYRMAGCCEVSEPVLSFTRDNLI